MLAIIAAVIFVIAFLPSWYFTTCRRRLLMRPVPIDVAGLHAFLTTSEEPA